MQAKLDRFKHAHPTAIGRGKSRRCLSWPRRLWGLWLLGGLFLAALPAQAAKTGEPFDEGKALFPVDADSLGIEDSLAGAAEQDAAPKALRLMPMAMLMGSGPLDKNGDAKISGMLQLDTVLRHHAFGVQVTPRLRFADAQYPLGESSVMLQQAFLFFRAGGGEVKFGKVVGQFGRFWDYGVYGPLIAAADAKLTPDVGASFELTQPLHSKIDLEVVGQYFVVDGRTFSVRNKSLFSAARARRKNIAGARVVPVLRLGESRLSLGLSGQHYTAMRPEPHQVWRGATDFSIDHPRFGAFVEVGSQAGGDINSDGDPVSSFKYVWAGAEWKLAPVSLRYHVNVVSYAAPYPGTDVLHQPGVQWEVNPQVSLVLEGALWRSSQTALPRGERSLYGVVFVKL